MPAPTIIAGPAIIMIGAAAYYSEGDVTVAHTRDTWKPTISIVGEIDERFVSQMTEISFKPAGVLDTVAKYLPYALSQIGNQLFTNTPVVVWSKAGKKETWANAAITKIPTFKLSPINSPFNGDMTITCLGDSTKEPTDAAAWNALTSVAFADTSFDETKYLSPRYLATYGDAEDETNPFIEMESEDGFTFEPVITTSPKKVANFGVVNLTLTGITAGVKFNPVGFETNVYEQLLGLQGADAILPGQSLTKANKDLVIAGGGVSFTLHKAGPREGQMRYGLEPLRLGEIGFVSRKTWTAGVINPLWTVAFA